MSSGSIPPAAGIRLVTRVITPLTPITTCAIASAPTFPAVPLPTRYVALNVVPSFGRNPCSSSPNRSTARPSFSTSTTNSGAVPELPSRSRRGVHGVDDRPERSGEARDERKRVVRIATDHQARRSPAVLVQQRHAQIRGQIEAPADRAVGQRRAEAKRDRFGRYVFAGAGARGGKCATSSRRRHRAEGLIAHRLAVIREHDVSTGDADLEPWPILHRDAQREWHCVARVPLDLGDRQRRIGRWIVEELTGRDRCQAAPPSAAPPTRCARSASWLSNVVGLTTSSNISTSLGLRFGCAPRSVVRVAPRGRQQPESPQV